MKSILCIVTVIALIIAGCESVGHDDNIDEPFDAGPILFVLERQLWSMNEEGSNVKQLTNDPDFPIYDAKWSPDGEKIAIRGSANPKDPHEFAGAIYVMNADGTDKTQVTFPPTGLFRYIGDGSSFVWSPDGTKIAFSRMIPPESAGTYFIFIVDLETGEERMVSETHMFVYGWYTEGNKLLVLLKKSDSDSGLAIIDKEGNIIKHLISSDSRVNAIDFSHDGKKIALTYAGELYIMDSDGNNFTKIKDAEYIDWVQVISPDGNKIIYIDERKQEQAFTPIPQYLKILTLSTNNEKDISPFHYTELFVESGKDRRYTITSWRGR